MPLLDEVHTIRHSESFAINKVGIFLQVFRHSTLERTHPPAFDNQRPRDKSMMGVESTMKSVGSELAAVLPQGNGPWFMQPHLRSLNYFLFSMIILSSANGYDGSLMNGIQALPQWNRFMNQPSGSWLGFINAAQSLGSICSLPVIAWSANKFGRKKTLFVGYFWLFLGAGLQTGARSPTLFLLGRLSVGAVTTFFSMPAALLITETSYPTHRGIATSLYNTGWYIG
jgi:hypothetical protein